MDQQWNWSENQALGRRLKNAKLRTNACVEDIDYNGAWSGPTGDPTLADGILDRLVHNAHRIEMRGDCMRKNRGKQNA